jgi:gas vesicle protein
MNSLARSIVGAAVTAAAVYFLDPQNGHQRRLLLQDRCKRAARRVDLSTRNLRNDTGERARSFISRPEPTFVRKSDRTVRKQVRDTVRHCVSHPEDVEFAVDHGHVILRGNLLPHEHRRVLDEVRRQPGVVVITDHLTEHHGDGHDVIDNGYSFKSAAGPSAWSTGSRVLAGCAGGALLYWGVKERKALGEFAATVADEVRHVMERYLREGPETVKESIEAAEEKASDVARTATRKVEEGAREGAQWAEANASNVIDEYAQKRSRQPGMAESTH